jgi:hypothetical protein
MFFSMNERRKEPRVIIRFSARLCWRNQNGGYITEETYTTSVSNSGARLVTNQRPSVGEIIQITLDIEGQRGSSVAEVKWADFVAEAFEVGICFE